MNDNDTKTDHGLQAIDSIMTGHGLSNADLVRASTEQLTFKMVQKARKGRRLTANVRRKVLAALQALDPAGKWTLKQLFNY